MRPVESDSTLQVCYLLLDQAMARRDDPDSPDPKLERIEEVQGIEGFGI